jgi:Flp pilus assembly protein TadG
MNYQNAYRLKTKCRQRNGAAVVELAAVLPVFVLLLMGTIETCNMIFLQQSLKIAAYEGARITIVPATDLADVLREVT